MQKQPKQFISKILLLSILNISIMVILLFFFSGQNRDIRFKNWETESNLLVTGENEHYDLAILGTSRGRVFSRDSNHLTMESVLGKKIVNLSKGGGGGLMPAKIHLAHFYRRGNRVNHVIYFIDPWIFFCPINNENNTFFLKDEPFEISILFDLILNRFPSQRIISYLQMIAVNDWKNISKYAAPNLDKLALKAIDPVKLEEARKHYLGLYEYDKFEHYSQFINDINKLAKEHNSKIIYVMLPILMRDFPGAKEVDAKLKELINKDENSISPTPLPPPQKDRGNEYYNSLPLGRAGVGQKIYLEPYRKNKISNTKSVEYYNLIDEMQDIHFFYDHMHFNNKGVEYFTKTYLKPIL